MPPGESAIQSQIDSLGDRMATGFGELKDILRPVEDRLRAIERMEAGCQPVMITRIDSVIKQVADHETRLQNKSQQIINLEKQVTSLAEQIKSLVGIYKSMVKFYWAIGIPFILAVGGFLMSLILGKAIVVFK